MPTDVVTINRAVLVALLADYPIQDDANAEQAALALYLQADDGCPKCARRCNDVECAIATDCGHQCDCPTG